TAGIGLPNGGVSFEVKTVGSSSFVQVDASTAAPFAGHWNSVGSPDGPTQVRVVVTDRAGNPPFTSDPVTFTVDNTNPNVTLAVPANVGPAVALAASATDAGSGISTVKFQFRAGSTGPFTDIPTATWDTTSLTSGTYELQAVVTDAAGNQFTTAVRTVTVDSTPPAATFA